MLAIKIYINSCQIYLLGARRLSDDIDDKNDYEVFKVSLANPQDKEIIGKVRHRYDDMALVLAEKVLKCANEKGVI